MTILDITSVPPPIPRDITGQDIKIGDIVITTESNRIIQARVTRVNPYTESVTVEPLVSTTGGRRSPPILRPLVRMTHNVYVLKDSELLIQRLRGFYHNAGDHPVRRPKKPKKQA